MMEPEGVQFIVDLGGGHSVAFASLRQARALVRSATARGRTCQLFVHSTGFESEDVLLPISAHDGLERRDKAMERGSSASIGSQPDF